VIIELGTRRLTALLAEFCSEQGLGKPARVNLYDRQEYIAETGLRPEESAACYSAAKDRIVLSPDIVFCINCILHDLGHHYQALRDGAEEFDRKYDRYTEVYGYTNNPYEVEAGEFEAKWWPDFERLLKRKLGPWE